MVPDRAARRFSNLGNSADQQRIYKACRTYGSLAKMEDGKHKLRNVITMSQIKAGTSWRELVDGTRYELAVSYLESGRYSLAEITFMLGFNDTSSFSRAFKRWSGKAPGGFVSMSAE